MDKYIKLQKIGQGSFGSAFLAVKKHEGASSKYVIKEIRMDPRDQPMALREARLLRALDHPNIIACKDSFLMSRNVLCIVTEYADGGDLRQLLNARTRGSSNRDNGNGNPVGFAQREVLDLLVQLALALKHLHDRKILHRDIKPENVFLTKQRVVKLGDFGVATVLTHTLACAETLTGTPYYTCPEICLGKPYNAKADMWSLGCVLYELLTLTHAFQGRSQRELCENIIRGEFKRVPTTTTAFSPELVTLVHNLLQRNPRDRPSAHQVLRHPLVMEHMRGLLSAQMVAQELGHTVLHGQHVLEQKPAKSPPSLNEKERMIQPSIPADHVAKVEAKRSPQILRVAPVQRAQAAANPPPAPQPRKSKPVGVTKPRACVVAISSGTLRSSVHKKLVKRMPIAAAKAKTPSKQQDMGLRGKAAPKPQPQQQPLPDQPPLSQQPKSRGVSQPKSQVEADHGTPARNRVAAFNAQWEAQRQHLLQRLQNKQPHRVSKKPAKDPAAPPAIIPPQEQESKCIAPPPAPTSATPTALPGRKAKVPTRSSAVAQSAAKQREAMKRDIQARKKQVATPSSAMAAPIILVQKLRAVEQPAAEAATPPPPSLPPVPQDRRIADPAPLASESASPYSAPQVDPPPPPYSKALIERSVEPANGAAEFQRMLFQLQRVVDDTSSAASDEDDDDIEDTDADPDASLAAASAPLATCLPMQPSLAVDAKADAVLSIAMLEDVAFVNALRALLDAPRHQDAAPIHGMGDAQQRAMRWMHAYIQRLGILNAQY